VEFLSIRRPSFWLRFSFGANLYVFGNSIPLLIIGIFMGLAFWLDRWRRVISPFATEWQQQSG